MDNSYHAIGSIYGCVTGIDCYDNPHCQRTQPEPYHPRKNNHKNDDDDDNMSTLTNGWLPLFIIGLVAGMALCCITSCCWMLSCLKFAYDDLVAMSQLQDGDHDDGNDNHDGDDEQQQPVNIASSSTVITTTPSV
jgi:hypothetical protein